MTKTHDDFGENHSQIFMYFQNGTGVLRPGIISRRLNIFSLVRARKKCKYLNVGLLHGRHSVNKKSISSQGGHNIGTKTGCGTLERTMGYFIGNAYLPRPEDTIGIRQMHISKTTCGCGGLEGRTKAVSNEQPFFLGIKDLVKCSGGYRCDSGISVDTRFTHKKPWNISIFIILTYPYFHFVCEKWNTISQHVYLSAYDTSIQNGTVDSRLK